MISAMFLKGQKQSKKRRKEVADARQSVQEKLPLLDIRGGVLYLRDGSYRVFVDYPGKNYSIFSSEQMRREAHDVSFLISSITCPFAIIKYPRSIESQEGLIEIEHAIDDARSRAIGSHGEVLDASAMARLDILERKLLPQALAEASRAERVAVTNVIAFCFDAKTPIEEAERQVQGFCKIAQDRTRICAKRLTDAEVAELLSEWLTPSDNLKGAHDPSIPLPAGWEVA